MPPLLVFGDQQSPAFHFLSVIENQSNLFIAGVVDSPMKGVVHAISEAETLSIAKENPPWADDQAIPIMSGHCDRAPVQRVSQDDVAKPLDYRVALGIGITLKSFRASHARGHVEFSKRRFSREWVE